MRKRTKTSHQTKSATKRRSIRSSRHGLIRTRKRKRGKAMKNHSRTQQKRIWSPLPKNNQRRKERLHRRREEEKKEEESVENQERIQEEEKGRLHAQSKTSKENVRAPVSDSSQFAEENMDTGCKVANLVEARKLAKTEALHVPEWRKSERSDRHSPEQPPENLSRFEKVHAMKHRLQVGGRRGARK